jgi:outer membrane protein OmpA-like peptidoglycan-associated protein
MRLTRVFYFIIFAIFSLVSTACKKTIPIIESVQRVEDPILETETITDVAPVVQPIIKQEVDIESIDKIELIDKVDVNNTAMNDKVESVVEVVTDGVMNDKVESVVEIIIDDINFDLDSYLIREVDKAKLQSLANLLVSRPEIKIQIAGNCDERGTAEYNLILGERRAYAARNYLLGLGVAEHRLSTISYGKEKPKVDGHDSGSWFINRNCQFCQGK